MVIQSKLRALLLIAPTVLGLAGCGADERSVQAQTSGSTSAQVREQLGPVPSSLDTATAARLSGAFRGAADRALPAVVQIRVTVQNERPTASSRRQMPFNFPGIPGMPEDGDPGPRGQGMGSGFVFDPRGYIMTNNHVVEGATDVRVTMVDGREYDAKVVGADPNTDVAVIKIEPRRGEQFSAAKIGSSDDLKVGDWVLALGNPLGLNFTVTAGIVSAKTRTINILDNVDRTALEAFIQTDAAINRGNSGGPLVDLLGQVVGINSAIQSPTGYYTGAGFAIPIDLARKVATDLIEFGVVHRPRLGVEVAPIREADAEVFKLPEVAGAGIASVQPGLPADRAGLKMGDVVVALDGKPIRNREQFMVELARKRPGDKVNLDLVRYGKRMSVSVELGEFDRPTASRSAVDRAPDSSQLLGFKPGPLNQQLAAQLNCRGRADGVYPSQLNPQGAAFAAGVRPCDELVSINGERVSSVGDFERKASTLKPGDVVSLVVRNDTGEKIVNYRLHR
jgi:serine protease Do